MGNQTAQLLPRRSAVPGPRDQARLEETLRHAHVHLSRYFRAWLGGLPEGDALADMATEEALARIACLSSPGEPSGEEERIAAWLAVAWDVAREVVAG